MTSLLEYAFVLFALYGLNRTFISALCLFLFKDILIVNEAP